MRRFKKSIDVGLELMAKQAKPGKCYTRREIAAWCGCSMETVKQIERRALAKLRIRAAHFKGTT